MPAATSPIVGLAIPGRAWKRTPAVTVATEVAGRRTVAVRCTRAAAVPAAAEVNPSTLWLIQPPPPLARWTKAQPPHRLTIWNEAPGGTMDTTDAPSEGRSRTFSDAWLKSGGSEGDLMRLNGWKSRAMVDRYADDVANQRALEAKRRKDRR